MSDITFNATAGTTVTDGTAVWTVRKAANSQDMSGYLPLSGGSMTGTVIQRTVSNSNLVIRGGSSGSNGAFVELYGNDSPAYTGRFLLQAGGDNNARLTGTPEGHLYWRNKNVTLEGDCLPISGGTMRGEIYRSRQYPYYMRIFGGPEGERCANIQIMGAGFDDTGNNSGRVVLEALSDIDDDVTMLLVRRNGSVTLRTPAYPYGTDLGGSAIVSKSLDASGYIKYASGWIKQWKRFTIENVPANADVGQEIIYDISFPNSYPYIAQATVVNSSIELRHETYVFFDGVTNQTKCGIRVHNGASVAQDITVSLLFEGY